MGGIGPAFSIPEVLKKAGLGVNDVDVYEVNEAFASQAEYTVQVVGIPRERLNPVGGAIALGHPFGCTGARQVATCFRSSSAREASMASRRCSWAQAWAWPRCLRTSSRST